MTRRITLELQMMGGMPMMTMNGKGWEDPITEIRSGDDRNLELVNTTVSMRPSHIHLVNFQMLDSRPFDVTQYAKNGQIVYTDDAQTPDPNQMGWKDVIQAQPGTVTRIIMKFSPYTDTTSIIAISWSMRTWT